jgi:hypothetical protein
MRRWTASILLGGLLLALAAGAQGPIVPDSAQGPRGYSASGGQSVLAGKTVGAGNTIAHAEMGWPGVSAALWYGASPRLDLGAKLTLQYAFQGIIGTSGAVGAQVQGLLKVGLLERGRVNLGLKIMPGLFVNQFWGPGLTLPIDFTLGFAVNQQLMLSAGLDFPVFVLFAPGGGVAFPVRIGGALEYFLDRSLGVTFSLRAGPSAVAGGYYYYGPGTYTCYGRWGWGSCGLGWTTMEMLVGLSYKL